MNYKIRGNSGIIIGKEPKRKFLTVVHVSHITMVREMSKDHVHVLTDDGGGVMLGCSLNEFIGAWNDAEAE